MAPTHTLIHTHTPSGTHTQALTHTHTHLHTHTPTHPHTHTHTHHRVGGSLPVAFSYFCEFFSKKNRGPFVIILAGFWALGSVFAAVTALAIIENVHVQVKLGELIGSHMTALIVGLLYELLFTIAVHRSLV